MILARFRNSFRLRLIVWTTAVAGTVLLGFGLATGYVHYRIKIRSVDDRLSGVAMMLRRLPPDRHVEIWERVWRMLEPVGERSFSGALQLRIYDRSETTVFASQGWPTDLELGSLPPVALPPPTNYDRPPPPGDWEGPLREAIRRRMGGRDFGGRDREPLGNLLAPGFFTRSSPESDWRIGVLELPGYNAVLAVNLDLVMREWKHVNTAVIWTFPLALLALAGGAGWIASRAIAPINKLSASAERVSAARLSERIASEGEDREFADLINVFNAMLARLERSFEQASRFSADAAHELKTPLAILQGNLESALHEAPDDSPLQRQLSSLLEETQRLKAITTKLLVLSLADSGQLNLNLGPVRLAELVADCIEEVEMLYPNIAFERVLDTAIEVVGDASLIAQIVRNLLANAGKYNRPEGGVARIELATEGRFAVIAIANTGDPIPPEMRERLFERFARLDAARNRSIDGLGLGLSLAREFARAHGGDVILAKCSEGVNRFEVRLPLAFES